MRPRSVAQLTPARPSSWPVGRSTRFSIVALLVALSSAASPTGHAARAAEGRPRVSALRLAEALVVDGRLDEPAWSRAEPGSGFIQREPDEGAPATERTEFRVAYNSTTLYIGVEALEEEPEAIVAKEMERDATLYRDDSIVVVLDTFGDRRNAYAFETNPNGARFDALVTDEGRDINVHWDGVWAVACRRGPHGWTAEMAIPFSTLRYDPAIETWGMNVRRMIRHKNEEVHWAPLGRDIGEYRDLSRYAVYRVSLAGELDGMGEIRPRRQIDVKPFLVGTVSESPGTGASQREDDTEVGLDVKWGLGRNLSLDLTYNTDFAEVEVDEQQVNLTRFSLFFPEKREFFLENAGIFEFGLPQRDSFEPPLMKVFFSRRIGLGEGRRVPIDYGGRLTGRAGGWNIGVLDVVTEAAAFDDGSVPEANFAVARLKRNIGRRSGVGLIVTDRDQDGPVSNRVWGVDFDYKPSSALDFAGFYSQTDDDRFAGDDWAGGYSFGFRAHDMDASLEHRWVNEGYRPEIGFLLRRDFEQFNPHIRWRPRINRWGIRGLFFEGFYDYFARASTGELQSRRLSVAVFGMLTMTEHGFSLNRDWDTEQLVRPFEIQPGVVIPPGVYEFASWRLGGRTNEARRVSLRGRISSGDFFNGTRDWANVTLRVRGSRFFRSETSIDYNDVELPAGSFVTRILGERLGVSFTPDLRLNAFVQYNDSAELVAANVRFNWIYRPGADLFVVYNQTWDAPDLSARTTRDRQLIVKFTYLFH